MAGSEDENAELLRRFQAAIAGVPPSELREVVADLGVIGGRFARRQARPELRRPRREHLAIYRIRVDLDHAQPPIWRRLDLRSDLTLDAVHEVLQVAFDWTDTHLHRFSLGGGPFDRASQLFLCPFDFEEADDDDAGGIAAATVRLDETLQQPGDVLRYLYDYGDSWEVTLRLEEVLPGSADAASATAIAGRRAAPPDDSGGAVDAESLALVLDDPGQFDLDALNQALRSPFFILREYGVDQRLVDLVNRLHYTPVGEDLDRRMIELVSDSVDPGETELRSALAAHQWFLDRAHRGGIELTSAGYLKPADVEAACAVLPAMGSWIGKNNREVNSLPLLVFREALQSAGLLRKHKGTLLLTRAGAAAQRDPLALWRHLAGRLVPGKPHRFDLVATLLLLAYAGSSAGQPVPRERIAAALAELGWRHQSGEQLHGYEIQDLSAYHLLINTTDRRDPLRATAVVSPVAARLARAALLNRSG